VVEAGASWYSPVNFIKFVGWVPPAFVSVRVAPKGS
jgi:hypothetical protein